MKKKIPQIKPSSSLWEKKNTSIYSIVQVGYLGVIFAAYLYSTHYASSNESQQLFL